MKTKSFEDVEALSYAAIDVKPFSVDWSEGNDGDWYEAFEASICEKCGVALVGYNGDTHRNLDDDVKCDGHVPMNEGPKSHLRQVPWRHAEELRAGGAATEAVAVLAYQGT
jgi:hypothetical protein